MEIGEAEEGLHPSSETMRKYNPIQSPGNTGYLRDIAMDSLEKFGVGVIYPRRIFYLHNDLHSYLASSGVDGVKVDVQTLLQTLGFGHGNHVALTGRYQEASLSRETLEQTTSFAVNITLQLKLLCKVWMVWRNGVFVSRLIDINENGKFRGLKQDTPFSDLQELINFINFDTQKGITFFRWLGSLDYLLLLILVYVQEAGVKPVLVGESLVKQEDPTKGITELFGKDISY
ncbi:hypothetical protein H5410_017845 [Solanum commersonii]|uniref:Uncharacterized protein n=1 Tax=Solanum commersonii TaxID=4109 RepID=A0A9J6A0B4_SOLCO|nr:hypothetical protein H5410_017845 [Solanum commersonii]